MSKASEAASRGSAWVWSKYLATAHVTYSPSDLCRTKGERGAAAKRLVLIVKYCRSLCPPPPGGHLGQNLWLLPCVSRRFSNEPLSLKFMIEELHPFLRLSLMNTPLTLRNIAEFKICACYINRKSNELIPLSLNGTFSSDLLRSELDLSLKKVPFSENSWTRMLTQFV